MLEIRVQQTPATMAAMKVNYQGSTSGEHSSCRALCWGPLHHCRTLLLLMGTTYLRPRSGAEVLHGAYRAIQRGRAAVC